MARRPSVSELISSEIERSRTRQAAYEQEKTHELALAIELFEPLKRAVEALGAEFESVAGKSFRHEEDEPHFSILGDDKPNCELGVHLSLDDEPTKIYIRIASVSHPSHRYKLQFGPRYTVIKYEKLRKLPNDERPYPDAMEAVCDYPSAVEAVNAAAAFFAAKVAKSQLVSAGNNRGEIK